MLTSNLLKRVVFIAALLTLFVTLAPAFVSAEPPQQGGGFVYYIHPGDTLFWISQRFGTTVTAIMTANGLGSDYIQAGQRLIIPAGSNPYSYFPYGYGSSIFAPQPLPPITPIANPTFSCTYTVRTGDTIFSIAYRYHVTIASLMAANNLADPLIFVNKAINVPCNNPTPDPFQTYTVASGDNLLRIAIRNSTTIWALSLVNHIPNPNLIFAGQTIVIPYPNSYIWPLNISSPALTHLVISQFRTHGPNGANDQFVEIYNPTSAIINVSGWFIKASNSGASVSTLFTFPANVQLNAGQHYLIANNAAQGYNGAVTADQNFNSSIPDDGGIALTMPDSSIIDQVGMSSGSAFKEGTPLSPQTTNEDRAYERKLGGANGNCIDGNSNTADFNSIIPSTPRNLSSAAIPCVNNSTGGTHVVISQFRTRGPNQGNDEFIELYNSTNANVNIGGWIIRGSNVNGSIGDRATIPANTQLNPGQYYLLTNNSTPGYSGSVNGDQTYNSSVTDDGGIALIQTDGTIADQVGLSAGSAFKEGTPLTPLTTNENRSYERKPGGSTGNCSDTNNNVADFNLINPSTPRNRASAAVLCSANVAATPIPGAVATNTPVGGNTISIQNNAFLPSTLSVPVGTTVTWTNKDVTQHTVRSGAPGAVTSPLQSSILNAGDTYSYTFQATGTYPYFDEVKNATGSITVQ